MIVTEPVIRPVTEPKLKEQKGRKLWPFALLLLLIPLGWWAFGSGTTKPVEAVAPPKPMEPVAVQAEKVVPPAPTPAPVPQVEVQAGTPTPVEDDPLSALPKAKPVKKEPPVAKEPTKVAEVLPSVAVSPPPVVAAATRTCIPDGSWKSRGHLRLEQLQSDILAKHGAGELDRLQSELNQWSKQIDDVPPDSDCAEFEVRLRTWVRKQSQ
jgi:hypothetical protein